MNIAISKVTISLQSQCLAQYTFNLIMFVSTLKNGCVVVGAKVFPYVCYPSFLDLLPLLHRLLLKSCIAVFSPPTRPERKGPENVV
jgi:hypothetical protein